MLATVGLLVLLLFLSLECCLNVFVSGLCLICSGLDFLDVVSEMRSSTFVALDGVDWLLSHVAGLLNRHEAVAIAQVRQ